MSHFNASATDYEDAGPAISTNIDSHPGAGYRERVHVHVRQGIRSLGAGTCISRGFEHDCAMPMISVTYVVFNLGFLLGNAMGGIHASQRLGNWTDKKSDPVTEIALYSIALLRL